MRRAAAQLPGVMMAALLAAAKVMAADPAGAPAAHGHRPNILLILADDLGYTDIGPFGAEIETPNLDALAGEGVRFANFHTSVSCSPTRAMLLTGVDNHLAGLGNMAELLTPRQRGKPGYEGYLNRRVMTIAELLAKGGYRTYMAGKWHVGSAADQLPNARGFERSFAMLNGGGSHWDDRTGVQAGAQPEAEYTLDDRKLGALPADFYSTRSYADFLIDAIRQGRGDDRPFFAYFAPTAVHDPVHVPEPWLSQYRGRYDAGYEALREQRIAGARRQGLVPADAPATKRHPVVRPWERLAAEERAREARAMEVYAGMVANLDYHIGRIVAFLKDIGAYENTLVVFTSDNGPNPFYPEDYPGNRGSPWLARFDNRLENIGGRGSFVGMGPGWAQASAGPLDRFKLTSGEGGIRTPLIVSGPGVRMSELTHSFSNVTDLVPTLLDVAGVRQPQTFGGETLVPVAGRSLLPVLTGAAEDTYGENEAVAGEMSGNKWIHRGRYKAVSVAVGPWNYGTGTWQLFDTARDPGETRDLANAKPDLLAELQALWDGYATAVGVIPMN